MATKVLPDYPFMEISDMGTVTDISTGKLLVPYRNIRGVWCINLRMKNRVSRRKTMPLGKCILSAFHPPKKPWQYVDIYFHNKDDTDCRLENMAWSYKTYKLPSSYKLEDDRVFVPSRNYDCFVNARGEVCNIKEKLLQVHTDAYGYRYVSVRKYGKTGNHNVCVHRLVADVFLEHPYDISYLVINHLDGNTTNNHVSNLEWTTYSGNMEHAFKNHLRKDTQPILVMDIKTRIITRYHSLYSFCVKYGLNEKTHWERINSKRPFFPTYGFFIKKENDSRPWPDEDHVFERKTDEGLPVRVIHPSGKEEIYRSVSKAALGIGTTSGSLSYQLKKGKRVPYRGVLVEYLSQSK